ncbi:Protein of unknown function [Bacillus cereus]|nr:Protein of unknown function [Bacillus cereus]
MPKRLKNKKRRRLYDCIHALGGEKTNRPADYQKQYVQKMVEAGADAIV